MLSLLEPQERIRLIRFICSTFLSSPILETSRRREKAETYDIPSWLFHLSGCHSGLGWDNRVTKSGAGVRGQRQSGARGTPRKWRLKQPCHSSASRPRVSLLDAHLPSYTSTLILAITQLIILQRLSCLSAFKGKLLRGCFQLYECQSERICSALPRKLWTARMGATVVWSSVLYELPYATLPSHIIMNSEPNSGMA